MEETMQCMKCGEWLPRVCNHCKWLYYVKPSRERAWLRELEERRAVAHQQKHSFRPPKP